ncbi:metallophosphoesterase [Modestobacter sp. I12A-02628]|uniref:Metallophosphoesterase n=1 Tax=Goekera deserti TaxID=2497753 RepID=A0A7K3WD21_9ACTN|nr:metallophosphoesterase [Goekera deserti]MPQ96881.1 metallophosphoesterase [Goekera deserti]NDI46806.1 metallophosphoesterase [Goekera deserti]NEL54375.1 metallophosphoesterase [Goekera deserti]
MVAGELPPARLLAISDLHVRYGANREVVEALRPTSQGDWLLVAGDVGESVADIEWALGLLASRFDTVFWVPGNHELWTTRDDPVRLRGEARYRHLVECARRLGVVTPEDPYMVWRGAGGPAVIAPLFLLYDYSFRPDDTPTKGAAMARAQQTGVICTDEFLLHPDPYESREAWCRARVDETAARLADIDPRMPTVLINHWPLVQEPTRILRYPEFAQWCGTVESATWHLDYRAEVVVYGHLHIPRTTWYDGVRFEEVSLGYPREWQPRLSTPVMRQVLPPEN